MFLTLQLQAQVLKVAKIRDEVRVDTYTEQTTPALQKVDRTVPREREWAKTFLDTL